jgi:signal transduction histidine kinase
LLTRRTDETSLKAVELGAIAAEIGDLFARASADGIEVVQEIQADCPPTLGEPAMLSQIIHNLCANACQAMAPAGGRLTIGARRASAQLVEAAGLAAGEHVEVYVSDTGHGIPEQLRHRVFEPFFTTREVGKGTGLGLFVVHGMVTGMGGAVHFDSESGAGTTFHVVLRVYQPAGEPSQ